MWVDLVRMRQAGEKRPNEAILRTRPERGRLTLMMASSSEVTYLPGEMEPAAFFLIKPPDLLVEIRHRLYKANVSRIGDDSFVVVGIERVQLAGGRQQEFAQSWWCRLAAEPPAADAENDTAPSSGKSVLAVTA